MMEWQEDILLQILLQKKFWMQDIGGQLYSRILMTFAKVVTTIRKLDSKQKRLAKLVTTFLEEPFMKWGLDFIGLVKLT
jgi:membrane protease subunit (stomatin/prohibitin family)